MGRVAAVVGFVLGVLAWSPLASAQDWPQWRGPRGDGVAPEQAVRLRWDREQGVRWRTPLARPGNGSPIVVGGRVFVTMAEDEEGKRRSLYCFDRADGAQLWVRTIDFGRAMPTHATNPHCSTTPASDGKRVVVWHASAGLFCYDVDGRLLWRHEMGEFRHEWGHGTSPVLHDGKVLLHSGPGAQSFVASFDLDTGMMDWKILEPDHLSVEQREQKRLAGSWCTPLVQTVGDRTLLLCGQPTRVVAYDVLDGSIAWWCAGLISSRGDLTYSSPSVADDVCLIVGGYNGPTIGVKIGGSGNVTETHRVWREDDVMSNCASGVAVDGAFYIPDMGGFVHCIDASSGAVLWKERIGRGNTWGSVVRIGELLYLTNQKSTTFVFEPNKEKLVVLAENPLDEPGNATMAVAGGELFLRTHEALYCIAAPETK